MGFSSGLPLLLVGATLSWRLATVGVDKTTIGLFTLVGLPYALKFIWAPLFDAVGLTQRVSRLGYRRVSMLIVQAALALALVLLGSVDVVRDPYLFAMFALLVAFLSSCQDIVVDAYRIEILSLEEQALGSSATQLGYRMGLLASGAGALFLSETMTWQGVYSVMAACILVGMVAALLAPRPDNSPPATRGGLATLRAPFRAFFSKPLWGWLLVFIVLYKLTDSVAGVMANPFYYAIGFQASQVAVVSKLYGLLATLSGIALGGLLCVRWGLYRGLMVCGILQMLSNLFFAWQAVVGADITWLYVTITAENLSGGMGSAAFVAFLSALCHRTWAATHFALLTSFMAFGRTVLASSSGWFADNMTWVAFFIMSSAVAVPSLVMLYLLRGVFATWLNDTTPKKT
ncbi:MAG: MFS transporter [Alphaproteobacteria bacterium GM202ARS2]|nr:MFS transporter [Alphaproteobacteria bacterium GM202ARS2]